MTLASFSSFLGSIWFAIALTLAGVGAAAWFAYSKGWLKVK